MTWYRPSTLLDRFFIVGIIIKGLHGALELLAGLALFFVSPATIHQLVTLVTQEELLEDPHDKLANLLLQSTQHLSTGSKTFLIIYLWLHAAIKLIAVLGILRNKLWAYPFALITLGLLMFYQVYIIVVEGSLGMILLSILDAFILWFIWREYGQRKRLMTEES